jgi:hypothetical protein
MAALMVAGFHEVRFHPRAFSEETAVIPALPAEPPPRTRVAQRRLP